MAIDVQASRDGVEQALDHLRAIVSGDGVELRLTAWDGATARVAIDLARVECLDCVLPPTALREVIESRLRPSLPPAGGVVVEDPREMAGAPAPAGPGTLLVLDPTSRPEGGNRDPGPDAGPIAGRRVGFRVDVLWRSWDWMSEEWAARLTAAGAATSSFRHIQGLAGPEGAEHHHAYARFLEELDVAVVGLGNCGSCTSWTIKDAVAAADAGLATVAVVTEHFEGLGRMLASQYGRPNLRFVVLPYPLDTRPEDEVRAIGSQLFDTLVDVLGITTG